MFLPFAPLSLEVSGVGCERGGRSLFTDVTFTVGMGETLQIAGANGAGKSTLMRMIAGFVPLETGAIHLRGGAPDVPLPIQLHYHGHRDGLRDALTAAENLAVSTALLGGERSRVLPALARMGAGRLADLHVRVLSAGQRRRVALARLLTVSRPIWLLDEPLAALDVAGQALVGELIAAHAADGGLTLVATHQPLGIASRHIEIGTRQARA